MKDIESNVMQLRWRLSKYMSAEYCSQAEVREGRILVFPGPNVTSGALLDLDVVADFCKEKQLHFIVGPGMLGEKMVAICSIY